MDLHLRAPHAERTIDERLGVLPSLVGGRNPLDASGRHGVEVDQDPGAASQIPARSPQQRRPSRPCRHDQVGLGENAGEGCSRGDREIGVHGLDTAPRHGGPDPATDLLCPRQRPRCDRHPHSLADQQTGDSLPHRTGAAEHHGPQ